MKILSYFPEKSGIGKFVRNFVDKTGDFVIVTEEYIV